MGSTNDSNYRGNWQATISFSTLIKQYVLLQSQVISQVRTVAIAISQATPGKFLLLQFSMSQVTQVGESLSNLVGTVNSLIAAIVQKMGRG